jgi:hypothetical protein
MRAVHDIEVALGVERRLVRQAHVLVQGVIGVPEKRLVGRETPARVDRPQLNRMIRLVDSSRYPEVRRLSMAHAVRTPLPAPVSAATVVTAGCLFVLMAASYAVIAAGFLTLAHGVMPALLRLHMGPF